jgi:hypothetical protein
VGLSGTLRRLYISAQIDRLLFSLSSPYYKLSYCTVSHGDLSCRGPLGLFLLKYLCSLSLAFPSHEILFLFKTGTYKQPSNESPNRTTSWIQQKNCNNLRLLLCSLFTTKTLFYVHHRLCGRCFLSQFLATQVLTIHGGRCQIARIHYQSVPSRSRTCGQD